MEKKQETMPQDTKSDGDIFQRISTVGRLAPDLDKILDVNDIAMVIVIDKKEQVHLRTNFPLPSGQGWGVDKNWCCWSITCKSPEGEPRRLVKDWQRWPWCTEYHDYGDRGPC